MTVEIDDAPSVTRWTATPRVLAVLVAREGELFLPRALAALSGQRRPPDRVIAVDTGSLDDSAGVVEAAPARSGPAVDVLRLDRSASFGDAVAAALAKDAADGEHADWLWLLHDDSAAAPDALERLLAEVETAPSVAVAGCKQVSWDDGQRLLDVGYTVSRLGSVVTGMDRGEVDQGQHDGRSDVLAVSSAGMLVRREAWTAAGGPDPGLAGARADLDVCRRIRLAGHRVVVVPSAVVAHAAAGATGRRPGSTWYRDDRHDAVFLRLATAAWAVLPVAVVWTLVAAVLRATTRLVLKQPQQALDEVLAPLAVLARPDRIARARSRTRRGRRVPGRALRPLRATPRQLLRQRRDEIAAWIVPADRRTGAHAAPDPDAPAAAPRWTRRVLAVLPVLLLAGAVSGIADRHLFGAGTLVGPHLLPAGDASSLWDLADGSWRRVGLGAAASGDPFALLTAVLSLPLLGDPNTLLAGLLLFGPLLAALTGYAAARAVAGPVPLRIWAALAWAAAPSLLGAQTSGRPAAVLVHVLLPLLALALLRTLRDGSVTAAAAGGLLLTAVLAGAPSLAVVAAVTLTVLAVVVPLFGPRRRALLLLLPAVVPAVLLLPWWAAVLRHPALLLAEPATGTAPTTASTGWDVYAPVAGRLAAAARDAGLAGAAATPSALSWVLFAAVAGPVVVLALAALLRRRASWVAALVCWAVTLAALGVALAGSRVVVGDGRPYPAPAASVVALGLLAAVLVVAPAVARRLRALRFGIGHLGVAVLAVLCAAGPLVGLGVLAWQGQAAGELRRGRVDVLPALAAAEAAGPLAARTLVLDVDADRVRWSLAADAGPRLGAASAEERLEAARRSASSGTATSGTGTDAAGTGTDAAVVVPVVGALLSDTGQDLRGRLADLGVSSVLLLPPVDETATQALDASPGLLRIAASGGAVLWRVDPGSAATRTARARLLEPDGRSWTVLPSDGTDVSADVPAGRAGRTVVLADRADGGWHASLDGVALPRTVHGGWAQAFTLPATGGRLEVSHTGDLTEDLDGLRLVALVLAVLVALPLPRVRGRVAPPPAPRRSRPVVRDPRTAGLPVLQPVPKIFDEEHPAEGDVEPVLVAPTRRRRLPWKARSS